MEATLSQEKLGVNNHSFDQSIQDAISKIWERRDMRVEGWPMMSSILPTLTVSILYVILVKFIGPAFMQNRKPFNLRSVLIAYNSSHIVLSIYTIIVGLRGGWGGYYSFLCQPVDTSDSPQAKIMLHAVWVYYVSKFIELLDTIFFVARKKFSQVSLLHVYHHGMMPILTWIGLRFLPGGHGTFFGLINSAVHVVMYTYYLLAILGPEYQKYIWWKRYLTQFQMIQFILIMIHSCQLMLHDDCGYPIEFAYFICAHASVFLLLFSEFYIKAYLKPKEKPKVN